MPYVIFTSYARANVERTQSADLLKRFLGDLCETVSERIADRKPDQEAMCFQDNASIELGKNWPAELKVAVVTSKVCIALYSPSYFVSEWCGKEFEVFRRRGAPIIPVLWVYTPKIPESISDIQYDRDPFPREYRERGLKQLMQQDRSNDAYWDCVRILADAIVQAYTPDPVAQVDLDLATISSTWGRKQGEGAPAPTSGTISKSCFVYVAREGWHWKPFPQSQETIGALSQQLSGQLGLQYEEVPCDQELNSNLKKRHEANVPTLLLMDPTSLASGTFSEKISERIKEYDTQYFLNCGALLAWSEEPPESGGNGRAWDYIHWQLCPQKTENPPPHHEWRTIFSPADLKGKALATLEGIRSRLLQSMLAPGSGVEVRKAENPQLSNSAAAEGIRIETAPQLISIAAPKPD